MISINILAPILFLSFCTGILLIGILLYLYVYLSTPKPIYLSIIMVGFLGILYIGSEIEVTVLSLMGLGKTGMQFHRIQALSTAFFMFTLPYLLHNMLELSTVLKKINRTVYTSGLILAVALTAIAFLQPGYFLSFTKKAADLIQPWNSGRASPGILYRARDIIISLLAIYSFILINIDMYLHQNNRHIRLPLIGVIIATLSGLLDFFYAFKEYHTGMYSIRVFSWFGIGMSVFIIFSMISILKLFTAQAHAMEKARRNEYLELLAGGIAHDFNNILTGILGNTTLALSGIPSSDPNHELISEIEKASVRAKNLSRQLLTFSKGGLLMKAVTSLPSLIRETVDFSLRGSNVRVRYRFADRLWNADIDANQISQVFQNLVINAKESMPLGGTVEIDMENLVLNNTLKDLPPGQYLKISVRDQGKGIQKKNLQEIFQPYFSTKKEGTGLGLAVSYSIIKKHNGYIEADSKIGEGSIFTIYLPATEENTIQENLFPEQRHLSGKALLMDDEEMILKIGSRMLKQIGFETVCVQNGEEAVSAFKQARETKDPFNIIILDLTIIGGMGGSETAGIIKKIDPSSKIIVSSGYSQDLILSDYRNFGFDGAIAKPYTLDELTKELETVFPGSGKQDPSV